MLEVDPFPLDRNPSVSENVSAVLTYVGGSVLSASERNSEPEPRAFTERIAYGQIRRLGN